MQLLSGEARSLTERSRFVRLKRIKRRSRFTANLSPLGHCHQPRVQVSLEEQYHLSLVFRAEWTLPSGSALCPTAVCYLLPCT